MRKLLTVILILGLGINSYSQLSDSVTKLNDTIPKSDTIFKKFTDSIIINNERNKLESVKVFIKDSNPKTNIFKDILPILTLLLGIIINRGIEWFINKKRNKKYGERWLAELNSIKSPIEKQIENLKSFKERIDQDIYETPRMTVVATLDGKVFDSLDKSELIKYFEKVKGKTHIEAIRLTNRISVFVGILKSHQENLS